MGHAPPAAPPLTPESMLRGAYIHGRVSFEEFDDALGEAILGVWTKTAALCLPKPGGLPAARTPFPPVDPSNRSTG